MINKLSLIVLIWVCVVSVVPVTSHGQSINIDYHDGAGTPESSFMAAGADGLWNSLLRSNTSEGIPFTLTNADGSATGVTATHANLHFFVTPNVGVTNAPESALLGDYAGSVGPPFILDLAGLASGTYEVLTYMVTRQDFTASQIMTINDDVSTRESATGVWPGDFAEGQSHTRHMVNVTNGKLRLTITEGSDPIVNGVQLRQIPEPSSIVLLAIAIGHSLICRRRARR